MTETTPVTEKPNPGWTRLSMVMWGLALCLWLLPLVAMQFTSEVKWTPFDFAVFGGMIVAAAGTFELAIRLSHGNWIYRAAAALAVGTGFVLVWMNLAVGIIGSENNPANLMFLGVLAVGIIGALLARFQARGLALTLVAMAVAQAIVAVIALVAGYSIFILTGLYVVLWLVSAGLFYKAERT